MLCRWHQLRGANALDNSLAPAVDVRPRAVADTVLVAGYVEHVAAPARARYSIMCLFVCDNNDPAYFSLIFRVLPRNYRLSFQGADSATGSGRRPESAPLAATGSNKSMITITLAATKISSMATHISIAANT